MENTELKLISAEDLQKKEIPPLKWLVNGLLPEGLIILGGSPKSGKSLLSMNLSLSIATGIKSLFAFETQKGNVLYLSFEDGERRLQKRLNSISSGLMIGKPPSNLFVPDSTNFPDLNEQTIRLIERLVKEKQISLVVIDTLGSAISGESVSKNYSYMGDYQMMRNFQKLATRNGISVIIVHHTRKTKAENVFDEISGTRGITGAADVNMVLVKNVSGAFLYLQGRDIEEKIYELEFEEKHLLWYAKGEKEIERISPERLRLLEIFKENSGEELGYDYLSEKTGRHKVAMRQLVHRMVKDGQLKLGSATGKFKSYDQN